MAVMTAPRYVPPPEEQALMKRPVPDPFAGAEPEPDPQLAAILAKLVDLTAVVRQMRDLLR